MPLKAKYCSQCAGAIVRRVVDDHPRDACSVCSTVFYENPLPVAASVVLNEKREVLLVKRKNEPHKGEWCLPIGFAEVGETIAKAARRELEEETGIDGRVLRLLDTDSFESEFYGDLLIVTFELEKTGGVEAPGDDAEDLAYYPLDRLPPLAFNSNAKAIRFCTLAHRDEWEIQDSFRQLQADDGRELLSDDLVAFVEDHATEVTQMWHKEVRSNPTTVSYSKIDADDLFDRGYTAISQFGRWLKGNEADEDIRTFYRALGKERKAQGFALHETLSSLSLLRKHVWTYARSKGVWERPIEVYRVLELNRRIALFFDKAVYYTARGFEEG